MMINGKKMRGQPESRQKQAEDMALPLAVLNARSPNALHKGKVRDLDPDLGWHINIES